MILITGSSGYVGSDLIPRLKSIAQVCGIDIIPSEYTDILAGIESAELKMALKDLACHEINIVNLAAARFDFGASAKEYFNLNVKCHELFLDSLIEYKVKNFIHVSSVASFDGKQIPYSDELDCDDAYRSTKYLQEVLITEWCHKNCVNLKILYPSAIFSDEPRSDTNIGKLQSLSKFIPFIPKIDVVKSLTYLPSFSRFIADSLVGEIPSGRYLTIEKPSLTVSKIIQVISGRSIKLVRIPFLLVILKIIAYCLYFLGFFGRIDLKLTPNRVIKLFTDTSYRHVNHEDIDSFTYTSRNCQHLPEILENFTKGENNA